MLLKIPLVAAFREIFLDEKHSRNVKSPNFARHVYVTAIVRYVKKNRIRRRYIEQENKQREILVQGTRHASRLCRRV